MRPLLVLVLVLAAIGALLFAVFNIGGGSAPKGGTDIGPGTAQVSKPGPSVPAPLETASTAPVRVHRTGEENPRAQAGPGNAYQFENQLQGTVVDSTNQPVANAQVILSTLNSADLIFVDDPQPDLSKEPIARTDAEGHYSFAAVEPRERYTLIVTHPDFARKEEPTPPLLEQGVSEMPPIVLTAGATLQGRVQNEAGDAIANATLHLDDVRYQGMPDTAPDRLTVQSGPDGSYKFKNVAAGQRYLEVSASGYGSKLIPGLVFTAQEIVSRDVTLPIGEMMCGKVLLNGTTGVPKARVLAIGISNVQQTARAEVDTDDKGSFCFEGLAKGEYNVIASAKGYRLVTHGTRWSTGTSNNVIEMAKDASVKGCVTEAGSGKPITSYEIRLRVFYGAGQPTAPLNEEVVPVNSADGCFEMPGCPPGDYVIEALAPGYAPGESAKFTVQLGSNVTGVTIQLGRGGSMSGRIVDADGKPVAHARIATHDNDWTDDAFTAAMGFSMPTSATAREIRTGDDGRFQITGLKAETYMIELSAPGFTKSERKDIRVAEGADTALGDVKLGRGGSVRGTIFDVSGKPLSGGSITLMAAEGETTPREYRTRSGGDGKFQLLNVAPGRYDISGARNSQGDGNPFNEIAQANGSRVRIVVTEGEVTSQDLHLTE